MIRDWTRRLACLLVVGTLHAQQQRPTFRDTTDLVLVDAHPTKDDRFVDDLTADDFEIFEDGVAQAVEWVDLIRFDEGVRPETSRRDPDGQREMLAAAADPRVRVFVTFLDTLHTRADGARLVRAPLLRALNRLVTPDDLFGVVTEAERPQDLTLGRRLTAIDESLFENQYWGRREDLLDPRDPMESDLFACYSLKSTGATVEEWYVSDRGAERRLRDVLVERRREDRVLTSLEGLIRHLGRLRESRTALFVVSDGWVLFRPDRVLELQTLAGTGRVPPGPPPVFRDPAGRLTTDDPDDRIDRRACDQELLRLAGLDNSQRLRDIVRLAAASNVSIFPVSGAGLTAFDTSPRVEVRPDFDAPPQLNLAQRDGDRLRGRIDGLRTAASETGGTAIVDGNDFGAGFDPIVRQLSAYYLLAYRSSGNDDDGAFRKIEVRISDRTVDVRARRGYWPGESGNPAHEEPLESTIGRALADGGEIDFGSARLLESARIFRATPAPRSPLEPTRDPDFRRTERIHVEWMKTAELDSQRARLLSRTGVELPMPVAIREAHTEGRPALHVDLNLAPLAPGEYAIEVIVRRGTIEDRRVVAVRVSR